MSSHVTSTSEAEDITLKEVENRSQKPCYASIRSPTRQEDPNTSDKILQAHSSACDETHKELSGKKTLEYLRVPKTLNESLTADMRTILINIQESQSQNISPQSSLDHLLQKCKQAQQNIKIIDNIISGLNKMKDARVTHLENLNQLLKEIEIKSITAVQITPNAAEDVNPE